MESYKHLFAKQTLARWLADPDQKLIDFKNVTGGGPYGGGVFTEYPFCLDSDGDLHGESPWCKRGLNRIYSFENDVPTYQQCLDAKLLPICIFDIALNHMGFITYAFEIIHTHDLTTEKRAYIARIATESGLRSVYGISADWVLSQVGRPPRLQALWHI